jgi:hypothetical protein
VFDFDLLRAFLARPDFSITFDALHAVTGAYAGPILVQELGAPASSIRYPPPPWRHPSSACRGAYLCCEWVGNALQEWRATGRLWRRAPGPKPDLRA